MLCGHCILRSDKSDMICDKAYFAEYHAAGEQDQLLATVKSKVKQAVSSGLTLENPQQFERHIISEVKDKAETLNDGDILRWEIYFASSKDILHASAGLPIAHKIKQAYSARHIGKKKHYYDPTLVSVRVVLSIVTLESAKTRIQSRTVVPWIFRRPSTHKILTITGNFTL